MTTGMTYDSGQAAGCVFKIRRGNGASKTIQPRISFPGKQSFKMEVEGMDREPSVREHCLLLERTQVWFPALIWWLPNICNSSFRGSNILFWPLWVPGMQVVHRYASRQNNYKHEIKVDTFFNEGKIKTLVDK